MESTHSEPDAALLTRLGQGDEAAFAELFQRYYERVYRVVYRLVGTREEAEDLAQETFLALYRQPPTLDPAEGSLSAWLCRVALNRGYNALRSSQRQQQRISRIGHLDQIDQAVGGDDPQTTALRNEERASVRTALARLPERQGRLLLLRSAGLAYAEIAAVLGVAPGSVGTLLARAERAFLKVYQAAPGGQALSCVGKGVPQ